jgi:hypothetical protein
LDKSNNGKSDPNELANLWTATTDARNYIIVGDPAVSLRVNEGNTPLREAIEPVTDLHLPEMAKRKAEQAEIPVEVTQGESF